MNECPPTISEEYSSLTKLRQMAVAALCSAAIGGGLPAESATAEVQPSVVPSQAVSYPKHELTGVDSAKNTECGDPAFDAPTYKQLRTMRCLINDVRITPITAGASLEESATLKTHDEIRCEFSHFACGQPFNLYIPDDFHHYGEVLAWGRGPYGSAQSIFKAWLQSPTHREVILKPGWDRFNVAEEHDGPVTYWTGHFGEYSIG